MSLLRLCYLLATLAGAALSLRALAAGGCPWGVTGPVMLLLALTISLWALAEIRVRRNWGALPALAVLWLLGPGPGLPLYLFLRTRRVP